MKKNWGFIIATLIILVAAAGYGIFNRLSKEDDSAKEKKSSGKSDAKSVVKVKTITASLEDLVIYINTTGTARAIREVSISPKVFGVVENLKIHENSFVKKNDFLLNLDNDEYLLNLEQAEAQLTTAKIDYGIRIKQETGSILGNSLKSVDNKISNHRFTESVLKLDEKYRAGKISLKEYEDARLKLDIDELFASSNKDKILKNSTGLTSKYISYKKAKIDYDNTIIKAPFSGYVAGLNVVEDENINSSTQICKLVDIETIKMEIPVLESEVSHLVEGRNVDVIFNAFPTEKFSGKIKHISPIVDEQNKTCNVIVHIKNNGKSSKKIKPGMNGNVTIEGEIYKKRLIVPKEAVIVRDNRKLIFIVDEATKKSKWLYIKTGLENFDFVEILTELEVGMQVVVTNNYTLAHDADVKVVK